MLNLETLSAKKLHETIKRLDARWSETLDATIKAGMGNFTHTQMVECAGKSSLITRACLARDYLNARRDWVAAQAELDRRKAYHGSDRPIPRKTN